MLRRCSEGAHKVLPPPPLHGEWERHDHAKACTIHQRFNTQLTSHAQTNRPSESEELEKRILSTGRSMLKSSHVGDMIFSLHFISQYLADRDHLLVRSAMFLVKAFVVYRVGEEEG